MSRKSMLMLRYQKFEPIKTLVFPVIEGSYHCGAVGGVGFAGYLLEREGTQIAQPLSKELTTRWRCHCGACTRVL